MQNLKCVLAIVMLVAMCTQAAAIGSCHEIKATVAQMREVDAIDEWGGQFAYTRGGSVSIFCPKGGWLDLIISVTPLPGPEFWPFFGRLAEALGVASELAIEAAQRCRRTAEARLGSQASGLFEGDAVDDGVLHVDCATSSHTLKLNVFRRDL
jgi:hypothetical protein